MNKEKLLVSGILFKHNVPINEAKIIGALIENLEQQCKKQKEVIDKIKEWEQNHTILVFTKEAPRMLVGTHELLHILYENKEVSEC